MAKRSRLLRKLAILALTFPLLEATCVDMATRITVNSFFDGITPVLVDRLEQPLDVTDGEGVDP